jgi:hypothetical protein
MPLYLPLCLKFRAPPFLIGYLETKKNAHAGMKFIAPLSTAEQGLYFGSQNKTYILN